MKLFDQKGLELEKELLDLVVEVCNVLDPVPEDFSPDDPFIGSDSVLGLDSLDAVEIVVVVEKRYNVRINVEDTSRKVFRSLRTLADYIRSRMTEPVSRHPSSPATGSPVHGA